MTDILIRGMEMLKSGGILCINIFPDGKVTRQLDLSCEQIATAVPLPEGHGRLIDADKLTPDMGYFITGGSGTVGSMCSLPAYSQQNIDNATTIVPSEGGGEDGN